MTKDKDKLQPSCKFKTRLGVTLTNDLAHYVAELIAAVKSFIVQTSGSLPSSKKTHFLKVFFHNFCLSLHTLDHVMSC